MRQCRPSVLFLPAVAALVAGVGVAAGSYAQAPAAPLTAVELRARVAVLEQDLAGLRKDYQLLLTTCQSPAPAPRTARTERVAAALPTVVAETSGKTSKQQDEQRLDNDSWYVQVMDYAAIDSSPEWTQYGWTVRIKNGIGRPQTFDLVVQFVDKDGLVIDSDRLNNESIAALEEHKMHGTKMIARPGALEVVRVNVLATRHPDPRR
jgi:hypothetical protein